MARQNHTPITKAQRAKFLAALVDGSSVIDAATAGGHKKQSFYRLKDSDPEFGQAWVDAYEEGTDLLEAEAQRRAVEGVEDFKMAGDTMIPMRKYSDTLLIFLLKARRPEKFRDNVAVQHSGGMEVRTEHIAEAIDRFTATVLRLAKPAPTLSRVVAGQAELPPGETQ